MNISFRRWARAGMAVLAATAIASLSGCITINGPFGSSGGNELQETTISGSGSAKILWLPISGFISSTPSSHSFVVVQGKSTLTEEDRALDKASKDKHIAAVVLRIDSPGGTVAASDEIYARIRRYHQATGVPVIASLGGVAASGGYYVAMSAQQVIAEPTTITGSIGVILIDVNAAGLMNKIGLANETVTSGPHKDIMSPLRPPKADEHAIVQRVVNSLFARFVSVVESNRPLLDRSQIGKITDGRIFSAADALHLGLIDAIGHQPDVLAAARRAAGVSQAGVVRYYQGRSAPTTLSAAAAASTAASGADMSWLGALGQVSSSLGGDQPLYFWRGTAH
jgi:protease-4